MIFKASNFSLSYLFLFCSFCLFFACSDEQDDNPPRTNTSNVMTIDLTDRKQHIVGFGGCNGVFRGAANFPKEVDMQKAYGLGDDELGLSMFRVSVPPNPANWPAVAAVAKYAFDRGALVFASPWDAPDDMLDPDHEEKRILPERYDDYVDHLNAFDQFMTDNGVALHAISVQNEPDIGEWTQWTAFEIEDFMKNHANRINNKVITPESFNFNRDYYTGILNEPVAVENFDIVGGHIYGNGLGEFTLAEQKNKEIWMTEYLLNLDATTNWANIDESRKWDETIDILETVHGAMESNWNAYVWWYMKRYYSFIGEGERGSVDGEILKRGYAFSQYAKYIRPGYTRIGVDISNATGLQVTAYEGNDQVVVVILNSGTTPASTNISIAGREILSASAYTTSLTMDRESRPITISDNAVAPGIFASSVTTVILEI